MRIPKAITNAAAVALLISQGSCHSGYDVPLSSSPTDLVAPQKTAAEVVKDHVERNELWLEYHERNSRVDFDASKKECSAKKEGLHLSLSCHIHAKDAKSSRDGFYVSEDRTNYTRRDGGTIKQSVSLVRNNQEVLKYVDVRSPDVTTRTVDFMAPRLCQELHAVSSYQASTCSDYISVSLTESKFHFTPEIGTDQLEALVQANTLHKALSTARSTKDKLRATLGVGSWFYQQLETAKKERRKVLEPLVKKFAATMKAIGSYHSLIKDPQLRTLFEQYPLLANPVVVSINRFRSSIEDPEILDSALKEINASSKGLPDFDKTTLQKVSVYIARDSEEVHKKCDYENAAACYNPNTVTIILPPSGLSSATLSHELTHYSMDKLPFAKKQKIKVKLEPLVMKKEIQEGVIRPPKKKQVKSWKDNTYGPRFNCPSHYAASNIDEYVAVYKEDLFTNNGMKIISLFNPRNNMYRVDVFITLETLAESGLFGNQARRTLDRLYQRAGIVQAN